MSDFPRRGAKKLDFRPPGWAEGGCAKAWAFLSFSMEVLQREVDGGFQPHRRRRMYMSKMIESEPTPDDLDVVVEFGGNISAFDRR